MLKRLCLNYFKVHLAKFYWTVVIFDKKSLATLSKYDVSYPISVFALSDKELLDILNDYSVSSEKIWKLFQTEYGR